MFVNHKTNPNHLIPYKNHNLKTLGFKLPQEDIKASEAKKERELNLFLHHIF